MNDKPIKTGLFKQPLQVLNFYKGLNNLDVLLKLLTQEEKNSNCSDNEDRAFKFFFDKEDVNFRNLIVNCIDEIVIHFKSKEDSSHVVFIDFLKIERDKNQNSNIDKFVNLYNSIRKECLISPHIIFYNVPSSDYDTFNRKLSVISNEDIDITGFDTIAHKSMSLEVVESIIVRAFYTSWGWHQIEKLCARKDEKTIAFFDIEKYTDFVNDNIERPLWVVGQLNQFHKKLINIIFDNNGFVNDIKGDEIMAVFDGDYQVNNAIEASFKILKVLSNMKSKIHIGIQTGIVIEGVLGTSKFNKLTQIGEAVNIAARICSPKEGSEKKLGVNSIHIGEETYRRLDTDLYLISKPVKIFCGQKPVKVYTISKK